MFNLIFPNFYDEQKRLISGIYPNDEDPKFRVISAYIPNGQSLNSDKFEYKMRLAQIIY